MIRLVSRRMAISRQQYSPCPGRFAGRHPMALTAALGMIAAPALAPAAGWYPGNGSSPNAGTCDALGFTGGYNLTRLSPHGAGVTLKATG